MAKVYQKPMVNTVDSLTFETVCAASGFTCPHGYIKVDTTSDGRNWTLVHPAECTACFNDQMGGSWTVDSIVRLINDGGTCPAGYGG